MKNPIKNSFQTLRKVPGAERIPGAGNTLPRRAEMIKAQQMHLWRYAGSAAIVGSFTRTGSREASRFEVAQRTAKTLRHNNVVASDKPTSVGVIVPEAAVGSCEPEQKSAEMLASVIESYGKTVILNDYPIPIADGKKSLLERAYDSLELALYETEEDVLRRERTPAREGHVGFVAVMNSVYAAQAFNLRSYSRVHNGRVALLHGVGKSHKSNVWAVPPPPFPPPESYVSKEISREKVEELGAVPIEVYLDQKHLD